MGFEADCVADVVADPVADLQPLGQPQDLELHRSGCRARLEQ